MTWSAAMKAVVITGVGGPEVLEIRDLPIPIPRGDQVRVRVQACALNRADILQCRGLYPPPGGRRPTYQGWNTQALSTSSGPTWSVRSGWASASWASLQEGDRPSTS